MKTSIYKVDFKKRKLVASTVVPREALFIEYKGREYCIDWDSKGTWVLKGDGTAYPLSTVEDRHFQELVRKEIRKIERNIFKKLRSA